MDDLRRFLARLGGGVATREGRCFIRFLWKGGISVEGLRFLVVLKNHHHFFTKKIPKQLPAPFPSNLR